MAVFFTVFTMKGSPMKKSIVVSVAVLVVCWVGLTPLVVAGNSDAEAKAKRAAQAWLEIVDQEQYAKSWEMAAGLFKSAVTQEQWEQSMVAARKPLGKVNSRKLTMAKYMTTLPSAPDGHYVVIQYETSFANKKSAIETITPMREENGQWRVSGYYIR